MPAASQKFTLHNVAALLLMLSGGDAGVWRGRLHGRLLSRGDGGDAGVGRGRLEGGQLSRCSLSLKDK
jgi:hypothetical protein